MINTQFPISFLTETDLSAHQYQAVKLGSADDTVIAATAGDKCVGILQNDPVSGKEASVAINGTTSYAYAGAAVVKGVDLKSDANGQLITAATNFDEVIGQALTAAAGINEKIEIIINPSTLSVA